jgi:hypothetical protein
MEVGAKEAIKSSIWLVINLGPSGLLFSVMALFF